MNRVQPSTAADTKAHILSVSGELEKEALSIKVSGRERLPEVAVFSFGVFAFPLAMFLSFPLLSGVGGAGGLDYMLSGVSLLCFYYSFVWAHDSVRRLFSQFSIEGEFMRFKEGKKEVIYSLSSLIIRSQSASSFRPAELGRLGMFYSGSNFQLPAPSFWVNGNLGRFRLLLEAHKRGAVVEALILNRLPHQVLFLPSGPKGVFGYFDSLIAGVVLTGGIGLGISFGLLVQIASVAILALIIWSILRNNFWIKHKQRRVEIIEEAFRISRGDNILHEIPMSQVLGVVVETQSEFLRSPRYRLCFKTAYLRLVPVSDWSTGEEALLLNFAAHMLALGMPIEVEDERE